MRTPPVLDDRYELFGDLLDAAAATFPEREAFVHRETRLTYRAWRDRAARLAGALVERGVGPGSVVLVHLEPSVEYAIACAAILAAGAIASGVNTRVGPAELASIIERSEPALMLAEDDRTVPAQVPVLRRSALGQAGPPVRHPRRSPRDPAVIIWTSGTTGAPKGAWFDHVALRAAIRLGGPMVGRFERKLLSTPFAHAGFMGKLWDHVAFAMTGIISPTPWSAEEMLRLLVEERINIAGAVPTQWKKLLALPAARDADFSAVRVGVTATAPATPDLIEAVADLIGCPLIVRYAMTESPSIAGTAPEDAPDVQCRTVGRPQEGIVVDLVDDAGRSVAHGEVGRLKLRSPCMMRGYWNDEVETKKALTPDGWLLSGDLARLDPASNIVLVGRTSEMYIRGGYNIYPIEVERVLKEHPAIADVAVVGVAAPVIGEIGVAFVVPRHPSAPPSLDDLRAWTRRSLADYKAPDRLILLESLPLTSMMKIDKATLSACARA